LRSRALSRRAQRFPGRRDPPRRVPRLRTVPRVRRRARARRAGLGGASAGGRTCDPGQEKTVETPRGRLVYRGTVRLDHARRRMLVTERHTLTTDGGTTSADYDFVMRGWTRSELDELLAHAGFVSV